MTITNAQLGVGIGFRAELADQMESYIAEVDFLEVIGDQCFESKTMALVESWVRRRPIVCHFLGLSLGTAEPLDENYLARVSAVLQQIQPVWFSDHLAVTRVQGVELGHLAPVRFTEETVTIVSQKAAEVQARFGLPFLLENITYHFTLPGASLKEWELMTQIVEAADCGILLDLNNLYVNAHNNRFDPYEYLRGIPLDRVMQVHIAGATINEGVLIDSHAHPVSYEVFEYLDYLCRHSPVSAILLERDRNMPPFEELVSEMRRARVVWQNSGVRRASCCCEGF